jgi:hypothetical protein
MARPPSFDHPLRIVAKIIGKNQSQMAEMLGLSAETIKSICAGRLAISEEVSHRIKVATGANIRPGKITVTTTATDVWGDAYTSKSFERAKKELNSAEWEIQTVELASSVSLLIEAATRADKANAVANDIAIALKDLAKKHRLGAELGRMLARVPRPSWSLKMRACDLRAVLRLNVAPCSPHDCRKARIGRRNVVELCREIGAEPIVDWDHPLTFDLRKAGGPSNDAVTVYGVSKRSAEWAKILEELPTLSGIASYCVDVRRALRLKRSPV